MLWSLATAKRNTAAKRKTMLLLRDPHLRFGSYAVEIIITFCVNFLRFGLISYAKGTSPTGYDALRRNS